MHWILCFSFCPALAVLSDVMGLSENLAGVTILAFGNGSPDIFTALADFGGDTELMYAELMGKIYDLHLKLIFYRFFFLIRRSYIYNWHSSGLNYHHSTIFRKWLNIHERHRFLHGCLLMDNIRIS